MAFSDAGELLALGISVLLGTALMIALGLGARERIPRYCERCATVTYTHGLPPLWLPCALDVWLASLVFVAKPMLPQKNGSL